MKKETWKTIIQIVVSILSAALTALGTTSCMGHGPIAIWEWNHALYYERTDSINKCCRSFFARNWSLPGVTEDQAFGELPLGGKDIRLPVVRRWQAMALLMLIARDDVGLHDWSSRDRNQLLLNMGAKLQKTEDFWVLLQINLRERAAHQHSSELDCSRFAPSLPSELNCFM